LFVQSHNSETGFPREPVGATEQKLNTLGRIQKWTIAITNILGRFHKIEIAILGRPMPGFTPTLGYTVEANRRNIFWDGGVGVKKNVKKYIFRIGFAWRANDSHRCYEYFAPYHIPQLPYKAKQFLFIVFGLFWLIPRKLLYIPVWGLLLGPYIAFAKM